jgi:hypothetical protein
MHRLPQPACQSRYQPRELRLEVSRLPHQSRRGTKLCASGETLSPRYQRLCGLPHAKAVPSGSASSVHRSFHPCLPCGRGVSGLIDCSVELPLAGSVPLHDPLAVQLVALGDDQVSIAGCPTKTPAALEDKLTVGGGEEVDVRAEPPPPQLATKADAHKLMEIRQKLCMSYPENSKHAVRFVGILACFQQTM